MAAGSLGYMAMAIRNLMSPHGRRQAAETDRPCCLGLGSELVALKVDSPIVEGRDDADVDASLGCSRDGVDPGVGPLGTEFLNRPLSIGDVPGALALEDDSLDASGGHHVHEDIWWRVRGDDHRADMLLEYAVETQTLNRITNAHATRSVGDLHVRMNAGGQRGSRCAEGVEIRVVLLANARTVEDVADAHVEDTDDLVPNEDLYDSEGVLELHLDVAATLVLAHLGTDDDERLLERAFEGHREEGAALGKRVRAMHDHEAVVVPVDREDHLGHLHAIAMHDVRRILTQREVDESELYLTVDVDPI